MCLKRIEIQGFKSFQEKVVLDFNKELTIIVGPNGSGKSNIIDAVRWVLGEHNPRMLRGDKMEEIIFSGSQSKKAVGMAEVSLALDNSMQLFPLQYNEIQVTRRLFRSGESEYLINNVKCRQKDIRELFLDTGLGRESYSIIGQGQVEKVLNSDPAERRALLEEAVSVAKYRQRKEEALKKLDETKAGLLRIDDLLIDLSQREEDLHEQAEKTKTYNQLYSIVSNYEKTVLLNDLARMHKELASAADKQKSLEEQWNQWKQEYEDLNEKFAADREENERLNEELSSRQQRYFSCQTESERMRAQIVLQEEKRSNLQDQQENLQNELQQHQAKTISVRQQAAAEHNNAEQSMLQLTELEREIKDITEKLQQIDQRLKSGEEIYRKRREREQQISRQLQRAQQDKQRTEQDLLQAEADCSRLRKELTGKETEHNNIINEHDQLKNQEEQWKQQLDICQSKGKRLRKLLDKADVLLGQRQENTSRQQNEAKGLQIKLKMLQEMNANYEGFQRAAKEVLLAGQRKQLTEIIGSVAELLTTEPRFEKAIETALGGSLQYVVTESDKGARRAIEFLKKGRYGRATFLPLNTIRPTEWHIKTEQRKFPGLIGLASELVQTDSRYNVIIDYLLGHIVVFSDLTAALEYARSVNYQVRIVTLDGDVIQRGGAMTGGTSSEKTGSLLAQRRQLREVSMDLQKIRERLEISEQQEAHWLHRQNKLQGSISANQQQEQEINQQIMNLQEQCRNHKNAGDVLQAEMKYLQNDLAAKSAAAEECKTGLLQLNKQAELYQQQFQQHKLGQVIDDTEYETINRQYDELQELLTSRRVMQAAEQQRHQHYNAESERLDAQLIELEQQTESLSETIRKNQQHADRLTAEYDAAKAELAGMQRQEEKRKNEVMESQQKKDINDKLIKETENKLKSARTETDQLRDQISKMQLRLAKTEARWENGLTVLREQYQLEWQDVHEIPALNNKTEQKQHINELKLQIRELGNINPAAIEEYKKLTERLNFLQQQHDDLQQGRESLFTVISELDQTIAEHFKQGFEKINQSFQVTFDKLFGGGQARLCLSDSEQILASGVEVIVQPPGKKLQNMNLLSGGEKALTAIALLFAILQTRPSPFCILDEIEASLDEANVGKFASFLTELSEHMPFLVISHRQGTIQQAKVLYGITMNRQGVSQVLSLDVDQAGMALQQQKK